MTRIETLVEQHHALEEDIRAELKRKFPPDLEVVFKFGNMADHATGRVQFASFYCGSPRITVTNLRTGKDRDIPLSAILLQPD